MAEHNPFGIPSASAFLLDPPPALTSNEYAKAYNEVKEVGSIDSTQRQPDRTNVALFYAESANGQCVRSTTAQSA